MAQFVKYMHLERFGTNEVDGIEFGTTYVFPKLDGTNGQVWIDDTGLVQAGSRNRVLSIDADNAGFLAWVNTQTNLGQYLRRNPNHTLYGEWLVPHSLKTYREDAWRRFYVFDVFDHASGAMIHYENYKDGLERHCIDYLPPIAIVRNGCYEKYERCLEKNTFGIQDGKGFGEGIVIKNYTWQNQYGRVTWAKLIANHFKEKHASAMGAAEIGGKMLEEKICEEFVTQHLVDKVHAKISTQHGGWSSKMIGQLLSVVWHDLITEEIWEILKRNKNPKIDFKTLQRFCTMRIKELRSDLF